MKKQLFIGGLICILAFCANSCKKDKETTASGPAHMEMRLTDGPGDYEKVLIDIQEVRVHSNEGGWVTLTPSRKGVYNLLDFNNGLDTALGSAQIPAGTISQIRLVLGNNNSVVIDGTTHQLETPSAEDSGLKLNVHETLQSEMHYVYWLDFDANKSIVTKGNGGYSLKPVIRTFVKAVTGSIVGDVNPDNAAASAYAVSSANDTFRTMLRTDGTFKIWGLTAGSYHVGVSDGAGSVKKTFNSVAVQAGAETNLGAIQIP